MSNLWLPEGVSEGPEYGTDTWQEYRIGLVTASRFDDVMTEPRTKAAKEAGEMSDTAKSYMWELVASSLTGLGRVGGKSAAMERGVDLESDAIDYYALTRMCDVGKGRFLRLDGTQIGATPDGFVEEDADGPGMIEVKCPEAKRHITYWMTRSLPDDYLYQVQGQLWVSGRAWCDFISYDDRFPLPLRMSVVRVYRDEEVIAALKAKVQRFASAVQQATEDLRGYVNSCNSAERAVFVQAFETTLSQ